MTEIEDLKKIDGFISYSVHHEMDENSEIRKCIVLKLQKKNTFIPVELEGDYILVGIRDEVEFRIAYYEYKYQKILEND